MLLRSSEMFRDRGVFRTRKVVSVCTFERDPSSYFSRRVSAMDGFRAIHGELSKICSLFFCSSKLKRRFNLY